MQKPKTVIIGNTEMPLKEACQFVGATHIIWEGVKYDVPEGWKKDLTTT